MLILENVYLGADNKISWVISDENGPIDFVTNGITKIDIYIGSVLVTSNTSEVTFSDGGIVTLALGQNTELIPNNRYSVILKVYDPEHVNGQVLIHPEMEESNVNIVPLVSDTL